MTLIKEPNLLLIPGPTPVPECIMKIINSQPMAHRSVEFSQILAETTKDLQWLGSTSNDAFILTGSGTSAMEASIVNFINPHDKVICLVMGVFGERLAQIAQAIASNVTIIKSEPGCGIEANELEAILKQNPNYKAVLITHNETSTGVTLKLKEIAAVCQKYNILTIVDAITSFAAIDIPIDEWGLDVVITGSQKALMLPPGLAMIFVSSKAWTAYDLNQNAKFYLDLNKYRKSMANKTTPFTPNVNLIAGLNESLKIIKRTGKEAVFNRHKVLKTLVRKFAQKFNFDLLVTDESFASNSVTSFKAPKQLSVNELRASLKEQYKILIADGQNELKGKIFRIGHMGYIFERDILMLENALVNIMGINPHK